MQEKLYKFSVKLVKLVKFANVRGICMTRMKMEIAVFFTWFMVMDNWKLTSIHDEQGNFEHNQVGVDAFLLAKLAILGHGLFSLCRLGCRFCRSFNILACHTRLASLDERKLLMFCYYVKILLDPYPPRKCLRGKLLFHLYSLVLQALQFLSTKILEKHKLIIFLHSSYAFILVMCFYVFSCILWIYKSTFCFSIFLFFKICKQKGKAT